MEICCCIYQVGYLRKLSQSDSSPIYGLLSNKSAAAGHSEGGAASFISGTIFALLRKSLFFNAKVTFRRRFYNYCHYHLYYRSP